MKTKIILFILALLTWILLNWSLDIEHLVSGIIVAIMVSILTADLFISNAQVFKRPQRYLWFLYYIPLFTWECIKANIDGAYRVAHPDLPIRPGIVKVKTTLKSDTAITFLANTITLKPGTMTVDINKEAGFLYVHWVDVKSDSVDKATELIVHKFERILKRIFE